MGDWHSEAEPSWDSARVVRVVALSFGGSQVAFTFLIADATQAAGVRAWHQAWLQEHRQRLIDHCAPERGRSATLPAAPDGWFAGHPHGGGVRIATAGRQVEMPIGAGGYPAREL